MHQNEPEIVVADEEVKYSSSDLTTADTAKEAFERAAKDQAGLPLEVRLQQFRQMLIDKQVCIINEVSIFFLKYLIFLN